MIIKGKCINGAARTAKHLMNTDDNENVRVFDMRGVLADDLHGALSEMVAMGAGSNAEKAMYHAKISPEPGQPMDDEKWARAVQALQDNLGLTDNHPRAVILHVKEGREHAHVVWGRVDPDTMLAWDNRNDYRKHDATSRQLEKEFGHRVLKSAFQSLEEHRDKTPAQWEMQQGVRLKLDPRDVREEIRALQQASDTANEFTSSLEAAGYTLAMGRRGLTILDPAGGVHMLSRTLGLPAAEVRAFFADFDTEKVPTVEAAQEQFQARAAAERAAAEAPTPEAAQSARKQPEQAPAYGDLRATHEAVAADREAAEAQARAAIAEAWKLSARDPLEFAVRLGEADLTLAVNGRGRYVAVDIEGKTYPLTKQNLGDDPRGVHRTMLGTFGRNGEVELPTVREARAEARADRAARFADTAKPDRSGLYDELQTERVARRQAKLDRLAEHRAALLERQRERLADNPTVAAINDAWQSYQGSSRTTLAAALDEREIIMARASAADAETSRQEQIRAQLLQPRSRPPAALEEGALYAIDKRGHAYRLDDRVIRDEAEAITPHLEAIGYEVPTVAEARQDQAQRTEEGRAAAAERSRQKRADRLADIEDVQKLREAWQWFKEPDELVQAIEGRGFLLARVTADEAAASQQNAVTAASHGHYRPGYDEGDLLAVTPTGMVYRLDSVTLDDAKATERLAAIDQAPLLSIGQARDVVHYLADHEPALHAGRDGRSDTSGADLGATIGAMQDMAEGIGNAGVWLEKFLFGGGEAPPAAPSKQAIASAEPPKLAGQKVQEKVGRLTPAEASTQAADIFSHHFGIDPERVEEHRRKREKREREDRGRQRER